MRVAFVDGPLLEYRLPFLKALQQRVGRLQMYVVGLGFDLPKSQLRDSGLDVSLLQSVSVNRRLRHPLGFRELAQLDLPWNVHRVLSRFEPDVVISSEMGIRTVQAAAYRRRHPDCRLVVWARLSQHSEAGRGAARELLRKSLVHRADAIITNGSSGRCYLLGAGADPARVHVVHQASALDVRPPFPRPARPLRLLFVGRLVTSKGLHLLLPSLAAYPLKSWELTIAGDGPESGPLRAFVSRHHLPVEFTGFMPRARLPELFADHDVFVFPTLKDEWGLVAGEALRAGLPVLGSVYSDAVCEIVQDGATGWVMRPDRPQSIRTSLDRTFAATPAELLKARELAGDSVRRLTPEVMADQFLDVIHAARDTRSANPFGGPVTCR
jgi:glycosyltransferase involved in cell wall biosynthesis